MPGGIKGIIYETRQARIEGSRVSRAAVWGGPFADQVIRYINGIAYTTSIIVDGFNYLGGYFGSMTSNLYGAPSLTPKESTLPMVLFECTDGYVPGEAGVPDRIGDLVTLVKAEDGELVAIKAMSMESVVYVNFANYNHYAGPEGRERLLADASLAGNYSQCFPATEKLRFGLQCLSTQLHFRFFRAEKKAGSIRISSDSRHTSASSSIEMDLKTFTE